MFSTLSLLGLMASNVLGHAVVETPAPRTGGPASEALCGAGVSKLMARDLAAPIEAAVAAAGSDYDCNAYVCRGYQFEDNVDRLQTYKAGDVVPFHINLVAGHRPGWANVSIIDPVGNAIIGDQLKSWVRWPVDNPGPDRDDLDFKITIPEGLESTCAKGGACAIQWYWWSNSNKQTYESCVDFVVQ